MKKRMKSQPLIRRLQGRLRAAADPEVKSWFENYLKNAIGYYGVKTPVVAQIVSDWREQEGLSSLSLEEQLDIASELICQKRAEEKFAGTIYIQRFLLKNIDKELLLERAEWLFQNGAFWDWSTCDWFTVRVLDPIILYHGKAAAKRIAGWRNSRNLWQRRASIVAFRHACRDKGYLRMIQTIIRALLQTEAGVEREQGEERFIQTGIGWLLADLSKYWPGAAEELVELHFEHLSKEAIDRHTKRLPKHDQYRREKREKRAEREGRRERRERREGQQK